MKEAKSSDNNIEAVNRLLQMTIKQLAINYGRCIANNDLKLAEVFLEALKMKAIDLYCEDRAKP